MNALIASPSVICTLYGCGISHGASLAKESMFSNIDVAGV